MPRPASRKSKHRSSAQRQRLRIIGGRWRAIAIQFPPLAAIRPTPDRVRETLFNWLQGATLEARCLDLFAGSGALGLEALSRGASHVTFVEREPEAARMLRENLRRLNATGAEVHLSEATAWLSRGPQPYDIVFLDPPFASKVLEVTLQQLAVGWVSSRSYVYVECPADAQSPWREDQWRVHRSKRAGQVGYHLLRPITNEDAA